MSTQLTLDEILPDLKGKVIALFGDLSSKRNHLIKQFIVDGFKQESTSCIVTLTRSASDMIDELNNFSPEAAMEVNDAILNERLQIIDMYSFRGIEDKEAIPGTHKLSSAKDLTTLSITVNQISKAHPQSRVIVWPYSLLTIYSPAKNIINFTQTFAARLNDRKQTGLLISDSGVITDHVRATLESIVDCVIETKREERDGEIQEWFRVKFFRGVEKLEYDTWTMLI